MGEGAGVVVLEELEHAKRRGAHIYAEVSGYGLSGDAHHITAPHPSGRGAVRAMGSALRQSGRNVEDIDHINCHATSTPLGDAIEATAMQTVLGDHVGNVPVTATKGATGHLLGAAGAVEAIFAVLAVDRGIIPPTINLSDSDPACSFLNIVANEAREVPVSAALTNSFGFGGTNCSLMFTKV
jgi:3-oxoacyl-[acyl-carrier-protein] synthase II